MKLKLLKKRNFRNFFLSDLISQFGTGMSFIGSNWFVLKMTGYNASVGLFIAIGLISGFLAFPLAGAVVDKYSRRGILLWSNLVRAIIISLVAGSIFNGSFRTIYIYIVAIVDGVGWAFYIPATKGFIQEILDGDELIEGNSLVEISLQVGMFVSAGLCGVIYKYLGFGAILLVDAATFLVSNLFIMLIRYTPIKSEDHEEGFVGQVSGGISYLKRNYVVFGFGIAMFIPFVVTIAGNAVVPGYVSDHLGAGPVVFGISDMCYGIGACLSGFLTAEILLKYSRLKSITGLFGVSILSLIFLVLNKLVAGMFIAFLIYGFCNSSLRIIANTVLMEVVPKSFMGRATAVWVAIATLMQAGMSYGMGIVMDLSYVTAGYFLMACMMFIGLVSSRYFMKRVSTMEEVTFRRT